MMYETAFISWRGGKKEEMGKEGVGKRKGGVLGCTGKRDAGTVSSRTYSRGRTNVVVPVYISKKNINSPCMLRIPSASPQAIYASEMTTVFRELTNGNTEKKKTPRVGKKHAANMVAFGYRGRTCIRTPAPRIAPFGAKGCRSLCLEHLNKSEERGGRAVRVSSEWWQQWIPI